MRLLHTTHRKAFAVLHHTRSSQVATMVLAPGSSSAEGEDDGPANEHPWAEQWLYVVSGTGTATVGKRRVALRAGSLLLIEKRERHAIRARSRLVTVNIYVPPAYDQRGEPLDR